MLACLYILTSTPIEKLFCIVEPRLFCYLLDDLLEARKDRLVLRLADVDLAQEASKSRRDRLVVAVDVDGVARLLVVDHDDAVVRRDDLLRLLLAGVLVQLLGRQRRTALLDCSRLRLGAHRSTRLALLLGGLLGHRLLRGRHRCRHLHRRGCSLDLDDRLGGDSLLAVVRVHRRSVVVLGVRRVNRRLVIRRRQRLRSRDDLRLRLLLLHGRLALGDHGGLGSVAHRSTLVLDLLGVVAVGRHCRGLLREIGDCTRNAYYHLSLIAHLSVFAGWSKTETLTTKVKMSVPCYNVL